MKNSEKAMLTLRERELEQRYNAFNKTSNDRKRTLYWLGFLAGALSSHHIEEGEECALLAEAKKFSDFFDDPDAYDLAEDILAGCFSSEEDLMDQLRQVIEDKRSELDKGMSFTKADEFSEFLGFCAGIICDGLILEKEVRAILERFKSSSVLMKTASFSALRRAVESAMEDGILTDAERVEIQEWIAQLVGDGYIDTGIANIGSVANLDDPIIDPGQINLEGSIFVLTGPMHIGTRSFIISEIESVGGIYSKNTTKKTNYVVVSSVASRHWRTTHFGAKIEYAKELIEKGQNLRFVSENALSQAFQKARE